MRTSTSILMRAPAERIYPLAAEVERWPELLPHYRWVTVLEQDASGRRKLVEMAARRGWIPVSWQAVQQLHPETPAIHFRHVGGITTGMDVTWRFEPVEGATRVTIDHRLDLAWPFIGVVVAERVIGPHFVHHIAGLTLARIKRLVESAA
ncbi:MAG TPA: SRPBCC family protein [Chloroflexota bacterium]|nr:SRPBCC family protein [Chloroflexota bacterium]